MTAPWLSSILAVVISMLALLMSLIVNRRYLAKNRMLTESANNCQRRLEACLAENRALRKTLDGL